MKHARKLASLLLALVMVFALATTAFADETGTTTTTGTITVVNPIAGQTYTAYKIFDVVYDEAKEHYSYTLDVDSPWYLMVPNYANSRGTLVRTPMKDTGKWSITIKDGFSPADFASFLEANLERTGAVGVPLTRDENSGTVSATGLDLGYYLVTSTTGALCNLTTTNPTATIHDKNDMPFEKEADKTNVDVGQPVNYTVTGKVPDSTGFTTYTYEIADTMSDGLTFNRDSLTVKVGSADVTNVAEKCTITYDATTAPNTFKVSINVKNCTVGDAITVTYAATVNEKAIAKIATNRATLTYSNDPTDSTKTTTTPPQEQKVYSSKIVINKFETDKPDVKLPNAEFVLCKDRVAEEDGASFKYFYKWNETDKKVEWVEDKKNATTKITDENGAASFDGLANGTYYLFESKAPAGYNQLEEPYEVVVTGGTTETELSVTANVANSTGTLLPSTGGMGTTVFYVLGFVLVMGAVVLLVTKKRMSDANR